MTNQKIIHKALLWKFPGAEFSLEEGKIVFWKSDNFLQPEEIEIEAAVQEHIKYEASILYQSKRAEEYPPAGDQLDALWKSIKALQAAVGLTDLPAEVKAIQTAIEEVKEKYPAPVSK